jgi:hypothetical protein
LFISGLFFAQYGGALVFLDPPSIIYF